MNDIPFPKFRTNLSRKLIKMFGLSGFWKSEWVQLPIDEIRKRARLLIVDDEKFFYLDLFRKDGYNIEKWNDVKDLPKIESGYYDIVLLDIQGIGKEHSQDQGLGIIRHLKKACPAQIVVAYSNADFSLKYKEFFDLADKTLAKQADYVDFKRAVDELLGNKFSLGFYVDSVTKIASPYLSDTAKFRKATEKAIRTKKAESLEKFLEKAEVPINTIDTIIRTVKFAIQIGSSLAS